MASIKESNVHPIVVLKASASIHTLLFKQVTLRTGRAISCMSPEGETEIVHK
jgi:hypothetical protein